jgi:hypothetical protein
MQTRSKLVSPFVAIVAMLMIAGCTQEKQIQPIPVGEMVEYRDPAFGFQIKHPKDWISSAEIGRARFYSAQDVDKKFLDPTGAYPNGAVISVDVTRTPTPQEEQQKQIDEMKAIGMVVTAPESVTVAGTPAIRVSYTAHYSSTVEIRGEHIYLAQDSLLYDIGFAGFGDLYPAHKMVIETAINSFQLPKPVEKGRDATLPSETYSDYDTKYFSFQYPDNFNFSNPPKGKSEMVLGLRGVRLDCNIIFDVFGAQGLTVDKVFDQNKGKYRGASTGKTTIGGEQALYLTYSATKDVERRVYFVVKNGNVIRIVMDWYKPQRDEYLSAYEKVINSVKLK